MNILFLDDNPDRTAKFKSKVPSAITTLTAEECIKQLKSGKEWDYILLDHDLGGEVFVSSDREDCGMEVVRWMVENKPVVNKQVVVHSLNHPAAKEMKEKLRDAGYEVISLPFLYFDTSNIYTVLSGGE